MSDSTWDFDDEAVDDREILYRRIPKNPDHRTYDAEKGTWVPSPGALRRVKGEGMSVHCHGTLSERGRDVATLYDPKKYGSICFTAVRPRSEGAGVLNTRPTITQEPDEDLRAAHAEVRPPAPELDRPFWSRIVSQIVQHACWVQPAD